MQKIKWVKVLIDGNVVQFIQVWLVDVYQLLQWICQCLFQVGLFVSFEVLELIVVCVEGNLFVVVQEIEKFKLFVEGNQIDVVIVQVVVVDSVCFDVFGLIDVVFGGEVVYVLCILEGLCGEGIELLVIFWGLVCEICLLVGLFQ